MSIKNSPMSNSGSGDELIRGGSMRGSGMMKEAYINNTQKISL